MKEIIKVFSTDLLATIISVLGSIIIVALTYYFTKKKERETEWQKEKLNFYIEFISSLTDNLDCGSTLEGAKRFARASNNLYLFANTKVISALNHFQEEIRSANQNPKFEGQERALGNLIFQIRKDLKIKGNNKNTFNLVKLWGFGKIQTENFSQTK